MMPATANDLAYIKRAVTMYIKQGPRSASGLNAMLTLIESLCAVIRKQEGIDGIIHRKEDDDASSVSSVPSNLNRNQKLG